MKTFRELRESVIRSEKVGDFTHELHKSPFGYQVRIYNKGQLYHSDMTKNTEAKGHASFEDNVAATKKQLRIKD